MPRVPPNLPSKARRRFQKNKKNYSREPRVHILPRAPKLVEPSLFKHRIFLKKWQLGPDQPSAAQPGPGASAASAACWPPYEVQDGGHMCCHEERRQGRVLLFQLLLLLLAKRKLT